MTQKLNGHVIISWPVLGLLGAFLVTIISGALAIGALQTHVVINTGRLDLSEQHEREHLQEISRLKARQEMNEDRIKSIENHIK